MQRKIKKQNASTNEESKLSALVTAAAFSTATALMYFLSGNDGQQVASIIADQARPIHRLSKREAVLDNQFEGFNNNSDNDDDDGSCSEWLFDGSECHMEEDVELFQGRGKGKGNKNKKNEKIDKSAFLASEEGQTQLTSLIEKMGRQLNSIHRDIPFTPLATLDPEAFPYPMSASMPGTSAFSAWMDNKDAGGNNCMFGEKGRISEETSTVFMLFPRDIIYESGINQGELFNHYTNFFDQLYKFIHNGEGDNYNSKTKTVLAAYEGNSVVKLREVKKNSNVKTEITNLVPEKTLNVPMKGTSIKISQPRITGILNKLGAGGAGKKFLKNELTGGPGKSCFAIMIVHTLPSDYKTFANGEFSDNGFSNKCKLIPVVVRNNNMNNYFDTVIANLANDFSFQEYTTVEEGLRGYYQVDPNNIDLSSWFSDLADKLVSQMCSTQERVQCLYTRSAWFEEEIELDRLLTTETMTTTEGFTTTTEFTTTSMAPVTTTSYDDFTTTEIIPVDMKCCGHASGSKSYNINKRFCCDMGDGVFEIEDEACK